MKQSRPVFSEKRVQDILAFSRGIMEGENGRELIEKYRQSIDSLTPHDMMEMENRQLLSGISPLQIKKSIGKIINTFYKSLTSYEWKKPGEGEFLFYLMKENRGIDLQDLSHCGQRA